MSGYPQAPPPAAYNGGSNYGAPEYEKGYDEKTYEPGSPGNEYGEVQTGSQNQLSRKLKSRHMQMIAIGMSP